MLAPLFAQIVYKESIRHRRARPPAPSVRLVLNLTQREQAVMLVPLVREVMPVESVWLVPQAHGIAVVLIFATIAL